MSREPAITPLLWWLVNSSTQMLESREREAVRGEEFLAGMARTPTSTLCLLAICIHVRNRDRAALSGSQCCLSGDAAINSREERTMQNAVPAITAKHAGSQPALKITGFIIFLWLTCITPALFGQHDVHAALIPPAKRNSAPGFQLVTGDGTKMQLSDFRGKVVLLNFWATDCGGCVLEIPSFIELENSYKGNGFTAVGVSMDISYENLKDANEAWSRVRPFIAQHGVNYPIAMGDDAISKAYSLNAFPATYLIDKSGKVAVAYVGVVINKGNVATNVKSLLSER
jgi:peroxiredoxin